MQDEQPQAAGNQISNNFTEHGRTAIAEILRCELKVPQRFHRSGNRPSLTFDASAPIHTNKSMLAHDFRVIKESLPMPWRIISSGLAES
jgi:hypothetical protein